MASPGSEGRGARVGGLELSPQRDVEPQLPRLGVTNTGVNAKLLHPECLSPFPSLHLSFPLSSPSGSGRSPAAKRLLLHFQLIWMQFLANIFMQIVLAPTSPLSLKIYQRICDNLRTRSETVGEQLPPFAPLRGDANGGDETSQKVM